MRTRVATTLRTAVATLVLVTAACEARDAHVTAPRGAEAFARFAVIGGGFAMGAQSGGVVSATQAVAWPALVAADARVAFRQPLFRAPGCSPPLVAPLMLGRWLSGASTEARDSSCAGTVATGTPPGDNLAIADATAWDALYVTPKVVAASATGFTNADRQRYPAVLANQQSQVTAALVKGPTFVAVELGLGEVMRAATAGFVVTATAYDQAAPWTLVPAPLFTREFDAIADSVAKSGAKVALLAVPPITRFPAFRRAQEVWAARSEFDGFGVTVSAGCAASQNLLNVAAMVPALVQRVTATGSRQTLSCADIAGAADHVLTAADVALIDATIAQMNTRLAQVATARGWAYVALDDTYHAMTADAGEYSPRAQQTCATPYGAFISLDGVHPSGAGHRRIADAVASAVNARYGFSLPVAGAAFDLRAAPCARGP